MRRSTATATAAADATPATPTRGRLPAGPKPGVKVLYHADGHDCIATVAAVDEGTGHLLLAYGDGLSTNIAREVAGGPDTGQWEPAEPEPAPRPTLAERLAAATHQGGRVPEVGATIIFAWGGTESLGIVTAVRGPTQIDLRYQVLDSLEGVPYGPGRANCWAPLPDAPLPAGNRTESAPEGGTVVIYRNPAFAPASGRRDALASYEATVRVGGPCPTLEWAEPEDAKAVNHGPGSGPRHWRFPDDVPPAVAPAPVVPTPTAPAAVRLPEPGDAVHLVEYYGRPHDLRLRTIPAVIARVRNPGDPRSPLDLNTGALDRVGGVRHVVASTWDRRRWAGTYSTNQYGEYEADREIRVGDGVTYWSTGGFAEPATVIAVDHPGPPALLTLEYRIAVPVRGCCHGDGPGDWR